MDIKEIEKALAATLPPSSTRIGEAAALGMIRYLLDWARSWEETSKRLLHDLETFRIANKANHDEIERLTILVESIDGLLNMANNDIKRLDAENERLKRMIQTAMAYLPDCPRIALVALVEAATPESQTPR